MDLSIHKKKNFENNEKGNDETLNSIYDKLDEKFGNTKNTNDQHNNDSNKKVDQIDQFLHKDKELQQDQAFTETSNTFSDFPEKTEQDAYKEPAYNETAESFSIDSSQEDTTDQHTENSYQKNKKGFSVPKVRIKVNKQPLQKKQKPKPENTSSPKTFSQLFKKQPKAKQEQETLKDFTNTPEPIENQSLIPEVEEKTTKEKKNWFKKKEEKNLEKQDNMNIVAEPVKQKSSFFKKKKEDTIASSENPIKRPEENKPTDDGPLIDDNSRPLLDEDVRKLLSITDELLGKLPEDVIEDFASSDDFALYERIMSKYHIK